MTPPAFIRGESVSLRPAGESDLGFLTENINDPDIWASVKSNRPKTEEAQREYLRSVAESDGEQFVVCADDDRVGSVGLHQVNHSWGTCEVGFWITPDEQDNGYGTEACELAAGYAFDELRIEKAIARTFAFNEASQALLESVGFVHEATLREHAHVGGERVDLLVYGLLADEFNGSAVG